MQCKIRNPLFLIIRYRELKLTIHSYFCYALFENDYPSSEKLIYLSLAIFI